MELQWRRVRGVEGPGDARRREDKSMKGCERGACADETRSGTCGPHRSEPVREPHAPTLFNLSTWMQPTLSVFPVILDVFTVRCDCCLSSPIFEIVFRFELLILFARLARERYHF